MESTGSPEIAAGSADFTSASGIAPDLKCPNCGSSSLVKMFTAADWSSSDRFDIYRCGDCGLGLLEPKPADIGRYYPAFYRKYNPVVSAVMRLLFKARVKKWHRMYSRPGRALEIGAGNGWMMAALSDLGWQVTGFERDEAVARELSLETGFEIRHGQITQMAGSKFELIFMFNVIEHVFDPFALVKFCSTILADGGRLIISTQNFPSWQARLTGKNWMHLDAPRHVYHFSASSFDRLFSNSGLRRVHTSTTSWIHDPFGWIVSLQNALGFKKDLLTTSLMNKDLRVFFNPRGLLLLLSSAVLAPVAVILSLTSWLFGAGAMIEVWAQRSAEKPATGN